MSTSDATVRAPAAPRLRIGALARSADARAVGAVMLFAGLMAAVSWRKWGTPEIDAGMDLTAAWRAADGQLPYEDVRYFYGPLGIYALTGVFSVFGASLSAAFGLGLALTASIAGAFYALARQLLRPLAAGLCTAMVVAIGFSGTQFNFVLPHTNSATFGLLLLLLELLALARGRPLLAGVALGLACLTRVEFAAAAAVAGTAWLVGTWIAAGRRPALHAVLRMAGPALGIPLAVLGVLGASVGTSTLLWENLWPADFLKTAGLRAYRHWTPFDAESVASTLGRVFIYGALLAGLVATCVRLARVSRARRTAASRRVASWIAALWPLAAAAGAVGFVALAWRASGVFPDAREIVQEECVELVLGVSWLPALALCAAALTAFCLVRGRRAPLSGSWPLDLALVAVALLLCSRAYDQFTMSSAAPYYAAPAVLLLGVLHQRLAERWPTARIGVYGALAAVVAGIALYNAVALYGDKTTVVHTAAGSYVANDESAAAQQEAIDLIRTRTAPGEPILAAPADGGMYFMTGRPPALYDAMFLPGLLESRADEIDAIERLRERGVRLAMISTRDTSAFETGRFGTGYNRLLGAYLKDGPRIARIGDPGEAAGGGYPSRGFRAFEIDPQR